MLSRLFDAEAFATATRGIDVGIVELECLLKPFFDKVERGTFQNIETRRVSDNPGIVRFEQHIVRADFVQMNGFARAL